MSLRFASGAAVFPAMARSVLAFVAGWTLTGAGGLCGAGWILGSSGTADALARDGQGRIAVAAGSLWTTNNGFAQQSRSMGVFLDAPYAFSPHLLATFGYWFDERFELSLEGTYDHLANSARGGGALTIDTETIVATLRWCFLPDRPLWPYLGGSFGWAINATSSPYKPPWDNWNAVGYGQVAAVGAGWDLNDNLGLTAELRYTFDLLQSPVPSALNAGGLSLLVGIYLRVPREPDNGLGGG